MLTSARRAARALTLRGLRLPRQPLLCPRRGARPVVPASSLSGKCRKRALTHYFSPASSPSRLPAPTSQPPACRTRPPLTLTRARTAPLARSHSSRLALRAAKAPGRPKLLDQLPPGLQEAPRLGATSRWSPRPGLGRAAAAAAGDLW